MYILTILCIVFAPHSILSQKDVLPVFVIDYNNLIEDMMVDTNPFSLVSNAVFADIIYKAVKKSELVVIFIEERLSVEDITTKDTFGSPYYFLQQGLLNNSVKYLPKIVDPYKAFVKIFQPKQSNTHFLSGGTKIQIKDNRHNLYAFFRDDVNETRVSTLRRHDMIMNEVITSAAQPVKGNIVAFYTGKINPVKIDKAEKMSKDRISLNTPPGVMVVTEGALFKFKGVHTVTELRSAYFNKAPLVAEEAWNSEELSTKMAYPDFDLEFHFSFKDLTWQLDTVSLLEDGEEVGHTEMAVGAPWNWAFYCAEPLVIINNRDGSSVTISEYKIQPLKHRRHSYAKFKSQKRNNMQYIQEYEKLHNGLRREDDIDDDGTTETPPTTTTEASTPDAGGNAGDGKDNNKTAKFGNTVHCGPYFNCAIMAGLFIVALLLVILTSGVLAMYNLVSNDRFDDPHGKPFVVNSEQ
ncbi:hypothetical protein ACJJTC_002572 [Scirpophaga incertulas]